MKIRIDTTSLLLPSAGVRNYMHYWLRSLVAAAVRRGDKVDTYPPGLTTPAELDHRRSACGVAGTRWRLGLVHFTNIRWNPAINLFAAGADIFHCSQHIVHLPRRKKSTATIFDMSCWTTPQFHTPANIAATRRYGEEILAKCDGAVAISEDARREAMDILRIPGERIEVIYPGIAEVFFDVAPAEVDRVRKAQRLSASYLLSVGCIEPRKNVAGLIRAYSTLPQSLQREVQLVVVGPFGWNSDELRRMLTDPGRNIRYLGYVAERDMPGLFAGAKGFVYPSYCEGFGLPAAQAMAAGVPVITSNRSCLPEVTGEAGICVDPDSTEELAAAMYEVTTDPELRRTLAEKGRSRAERFRWEASANEWLDFFHRVASR